MPLEIEIKFVLDDPAAMRQRLLDAAAEPAGMVLEHNTYFDTPDRQLRREDRVLRIRISESPDGHRRIILTSKGPRRAGELKIRPEAEAVLENFDEGVAVLASLGFEPTLHFQKRRETFRLAPAEVVIDELPELGFYLEIEAPDESGVRQVRSALGLAETPAVAHTYTALIARHLDGDRNELTF